MTTKHPTCQTVKIRIENRSGCIYVSSDDVEGLWLWGKDPEQVFQNIIPAIQTLYKYNHGIEVKVVEEKLGLFSRLAKQVLIGTLWPDKPIDTYKICPITSANISSVHG